jgi:sporulation protein YlmC with PRC-barrel domain
MTLRSRRRETEIWQDPFCGSGLPPTCITQQGRGVHSGYGQGTGSLVLITRKGGSTMQVSDEHLRRRTVIAADGQAIGEVAALSIDTSKWTVIALQIKLHKAAADQLGAARGILRAATLELPVRMVQSVGDAILLTVPTLELRDIVPDGADRQEEKT